MEQGLPSTALSLPGPSWVRDGWLPLSLRTRRAWRMSRSPTPTAQRYRWRLRSPTSTKHLRKQARGQVSPIPTTAICWTSYRWAPAWSPSTTTATISRISTSRLLPTWPGWFRTARARMRSSETMATALSPTLRMRLESPTRTPRAMVAAPPITIMTATRTYSWPTGAPASCSETMGTGLLWTWPSPQASLTPTRRIAPWGAPGATLTATGLWIS